MDLSLDIPFTFKSDNYRQMCRFTLLEKQFALHVKADGLIQRSLGQRPR